MKTRFAQALAFTAFFVALSSDPALADFSSTYTAGHADIAVDYNPTGGLSFFYELSSTAVVNGAVVGGSGAAGDPTTIAVIVPDSVLTTGDATLPAPFAGNSLYLLRQTSQGAASRPFLGFGAEEIGAGVFVDDTLSLRLTNFTSSRGGQFIAYTNGAQGSPNMNTADGLSSTDLINLFAGGHDHYNLAFTASGTYDLTFTVSGNLVSGGTASASSVFHFVVGNAAPASVPEPASMALTALGLSGVGLLVARRRRFPC